MTTVPLRRSATPWQLGFLALLAAGCQAPGGAEARADFVTTEYRKEEEAVEAAFPAAARIVSESVLLGPRDRRAIEAAVGFPVPERRFVVHAGVLAGGEVEGLAVVQAEIGKFKEFHFLVVMDPGGQLRRVEVLVYRESRGGEIAQRRFLAQFEGKTLRDPIQAHRDIVNISGATMSVAALTRGVRKVLGVVETLYVRQPEALRALGKLPGRPRGGSEGAARAADTDRGLEDARRDRRREVRSRERGHDVGSTPGAGDGQTLVCLREARLAMGALCEVEAWGPDHGRLREALGAAFDEIEACEASWSDYRPGSELSVLSERSGQGAFPVSARAAALLALGLRLWRASGHALDLTVGPAVDAWGLRGGPPRRPSPDELARLRARVGMDKVSLRTSTKGGWEAALAAGGMRLDPGAIGKGLALDRAARVLRERGVERALLDFSGNLLAIGAPPDEPAGWLVAVEDPAPGGGILATVRLRDQAIATSAPRGREAEPGEGRRGHILSPATLEPAVGVLGASVIAPDAGAADGWATALCVLGAAGLERLAEERDTAAIVTRMPRVRAVLRWPVDAGRSVARARVEGASP